MNVFYNNIVRIIILAGIIALLAIGFGFASASDAMALQTGTSFLDANGYYTVIGADCFANRASGDFYPRGQNSAYCEDGIVTPRVVVAKPTRKVKKTESSFIPSTPTLVPSTPVPSTPTLIPSTPTQVPSTLVPSTSTQVPSTPVPATSTPVPSTPIPATKTPVPSTPVPATKTPCKPNHSSAIPLMFVTVLLSEVGKTRKTSKRLSIANVKRFDIGLDKRLYMNVDEVSYVAKVPMKIIEVHIQTMVHGEGSNTSELDYFRKF